ncbi:hypothetical protein JW960_16680 [candidate division KSB1 bacterium]|nr:hypothetical protein [candidate division KSB1 bacterium]
MSIFIWIVIFGAAIWLLKYVIDHKLLKVKRVDPKLRAFKLLKRRYASGEIKRQEYESEKSKLEL